MDIESVSQSVEVDKGCVITNITPIAAATPTLSVSAVQIRHRLEARNCT